MIGQAIKCDNCGKVDIENSIETAKWPAPSTVEPGKGWLVVNVRGTSSTAHLCCVECLVAYYKERSRI